MKLFTGSSPLTPLDKLQIVLTFLCILIAFVYPKLGDGLFARIEQLLRSVGRRPRLAVVICASLPLALRALLLPVYAPPTPSVHDEYGYLLQADTFASGRLTNPPPPYPEHFESIYILTRPTYTSQYEPAQGLLLALAKRVTGCPWLGVFFSMGVLCALLYWMLLAWLPPEWALVGVLIAIFQFGVLSYWMNSYFGGSVPAIGGTLVLGALARLRERPSTLYAVLAAVGIVILINSRPLEGVLLALIFAGTVSYWLFVTKQLAPVTFFRNVFAPAAAIIVAAGVFDLYYNERVTGNATKLPYVLNRELYGTPQGFFWQKAYYVNRPMPPDIRAEYEQQLRNHARGKSLRGLIAATSGKLRTFWSFYLGPALTVPLIFIPFIWRGRNMGLVVAAVIALGFTNLTFFAYLPHYSAPITGAILLVIVLCLRRMRADSIRGMFLSRALSLVCAIGLVLPVLGRFAEPLLPGHISSIAKSWSSEFQSPWPRERLAAEIIPREGKDLVLVRYQFPDHVVYDEWVFNRANLDQAKIVWARELDPESNKRLIQRFPGRKIWLGEPDARPPRLVPYPEADLRASK